MWGTQRRPEIQVVFYLSSPPSTVANQDSRQFNSIFKIKGVMKKSLFPLLLLLSTLQSLGQNKLTGKWYSFSWDMMKVVEYNFDTSYFFVTNLDWDLKKESATRTSQIIKTIKVHENLYYLLKSPQDTTITNLTILSDIHSDSCFKESTASEEHTNFKQSSEALQYIQLDTFKRPGLIFYSEKQFVRFKSFPAPSTITKENYKKYLQGLIEARQGFERYSSRHPDEFGLMFFIFFVSNQSRKILVDLGYNPIIDDKHLESIGSKFEKDPIIKDLKEKALKFDMTGSL